VDGKFYIVHNGKVLENPQDSVSNALELLQLVEEMGGKVNWNALLVVEAGNEQGQRQSKQFPQFQLTKIRTLEVIMYLLTLNQRIWTHCFQRNTMES
jgi:hypothetical protein